MRVVSAVGTSFGVATLVFLLACDRDQQQMENHLELVLGGNNRSLSQDLARLDEAWRRSRGEPPRRSEPAQPEPEPTRQEPTRQEPTRQEPTRQEPARQEPAQPEPAQPGPEQPGPAQPAEPTDPVPAAMRTVHLARGENLYRLAVRHLGAGRRWTEIAELNGWSEHQATSLRAGTPVRLPPR